MITIRETTENELSALRDMWNDGEVMTYVGFPNGLGISEAKMGEWHAAIKSAPHTKHYSIIDRDKGFMGETFYSFKNDAEPAKVDIKLIKGARKQNIATKALSFALDQLFLNTPARLVSVDPNINNLPALKLYHKLGFIEKGHREYQTLKVVYMELEKSAWQKARIASVNLVDIHFDNFIEACFLKVKEDQTHFIATNSFSLAQSKYQSECIPKAIYAGHNMVGFIMYCLDRTDHEYWIYRLMVDRNYQGLGYGRRAMELVLGILMPLAKNHKIKISFEPENANAKALYESLGFRTTGVIDEGEIVYEKTW